MGKKSVLLKNGAKYNRWTIIKLDHIKCTDCNRNREHYLCRCDCGTKKTVFKSLLTFGSSKSCGCLNREICTKHNMTGTRIYNIWRSMRVRCYKIDDDHYKNWGKRGITVCDEWRKEFINFYNWAITNGYKKNLSIDRINNDGNYEPSNCRWATQKEQGSNMRSNRNITFNGETHCVSEWSRLLGINYANLIYRLNTDMSIKKAFTKKINNNKGKKK